MCSQQQLAPAAACLPATDKAGYIAPVNSDYGTATYWQQRFETEASYEWLLPYDSVMEWLRSHVQPGDRILMVGCGNSAFPLDMAADGYAHVTATDLSANVVQHMQQQDQQGTRVCWQVADMLALPFPDGSFDVVIEKAAIDCFFTSSTSPWQPSAETQAQVHGALTEAHRSAAQTLGHGCVHICSNSCNATYAPVGDLHAHPCVAVSSFSPTCDACHDAQPGVICILSQHKAIGLVSQVDYTGVSAKHSCSAAVTTCCTHQQWAPAC